MSDWVRVCGTDHEVIAAWCRKRNIKYEYHFGLVNHEVYTMDYDWLIEDEKERTMFVLKWGGHVK